MKKAKQLFAGILILAMLLSLSMVTNAQTKEESQYLDYSQFRANTEAMGIVDSKTPKTANDIEEKWATKFGTDWNATPGTPIVIGDYLYALVAGQQKLYRVDIKTGKILNSVECKGSSQFFSMIGYGDGKIFVPRNSTNADGKSVAIIMAYDEATMNMLWQSEPIGDELAGIQALSAITYYNGYIYVGASNGSASNGAFACFKVNDEDISKPDEIKKATWVYTPQAPMKSGYYWCGGAIVGNSIVFGGEATELVIHSLTEDKVLDKITLETNVKSGIRSSIYYDNDLKTVFAATKEGNLYSIKLSSNETFDRSSIKKVNIGTDITSSPVVFRERVYIGGGGMGGNAGFTVLNANTMEIIYSIKNIKSQSAPIITTAYATKENNWKVYAYVVRFDKPSTLYAMSDCEGQQVASFEELISPSVPQFCSQSVAIDKDGNFYYYNDSGNIFKFGSKNSENSEFTATDVDNAILLHKENNKISSEDLFSLKRIEIRYNNLSDSEKSKVLYLNDLKQMIKNSENLKDEIFVVQKLNNDLAGYDFSNISLKDNDAITAFMISFNSLSDEGKAQITNAKVLIEANEKLTALKNDKLVSEINAKIDALPNDNALCLDDKKAVDDLILEVNNQKVEVKAKINTEKLNAKKAKITEIENAVNKLNDRIWNELKPANITVNDEDTVNSLIADYNKIAEKDRKYVIGYDEVLQAKKEIIEMKNNMETTTQPMEKEENPKTETGENTEVPKTGEQSEKNLIVAFGVIILSAGACLYSIKRKDKQRKF
ncbi:MAG: LPXTG cell wall anchor domain-containing protein [Oscillospiraceae bacterium]